VTLRPLTLPAGMATAALGGASVGVGTITYAHGDGSFRYGATDATDDLQLEATTGVRSCTDCSPLFPERGVVAGAAARLSVLRTNGQQLAVTAGGSAVDWHVSGTKLGFEASLLHDVAFGRFALVTRIATLHGDHPWNLTVALEPPADSGRPPAARGRLLTRAHGAGAGPPAAVCPRAGTRVRRFASAQRLSLGRRSTRLLAPRQEEP
jgi:hypothetical protein